MRILAVVDAIKTKTILQAFLNTDVRLYVSVTQCKVLIRQFIQPPAFSGRLL